MNLQAFVVSHTHLSLYLTLSFALRFTSHAIHSNIQEITRVEYLLKHKLFLILRLMCETTRFLSLIYIFHRPYNQYSSSSFKKIKVVFFSILIGFQWTMYAFNDDNGSIFANQIWPSENKELRVPIYGWAFYTRKAMYRWCCAN